MADLVGQQFGRYRLVKLLERGSIKTFYLGEDIVSGNPVVVSVLPPHADKEQFFQEVAILSRLAHPDIVRLLDSGVQNNIPYIVTAYAPKGSLRQKHPRGTQVSLSLVVSYVKQIAAALQYIHDRGIIHRDVKPDNLLIGANDEIWLSDFSFAIRTQSTGEEPSVIGTPLYMAPELLRGRAVLASDQYALGIVVYEWLAGHPPLQGTSIAIITQQLHTPPPPLRSQVPGIPALVEEVVNKALAKEPEKRFASMKAFADALEQASQLTPRPLPTVPGKSTPPAVTGSIAQQNRGSSQEVDQTISGNFVANPLKNYDDEATRIGVGDRAVSNMGSRGQREQKTELSLFAIARAVLEQDNRAVVGKVYTVQTGISQSLPGNFQGEPFELSVHSLNEKLWFDIIIHPGDNVAIVREWHKRLPYDPRNPNPQLVEFLFRAHAPGHTSLAVSYYYERRWLKTTRLEFEIFETIPVATTLGGLHGS